MVSITITYDNPETTPPVFVSGTFTNWIPVELDSSTSTDDSSKFIHTKTLDVSPGDHQYKFRLGPGDWWACDASKPMSDDGQGNINNTISVNESNNTLGDTTQFNIDGAYDSDREPTAITIKELNGSAEDFEADTVTSRAMRSAEEEEPIRKLENKTTTLSLQKSSGDSNETEKLDGVVENSTLHEKADVRMIGGLDGTSEPVESIKSVDESQATADFVSSTKANGHLVNGKMPSKTVSSNQPETTSTPDDIVSATTKLNGLDKKSPTVKEADSIRSEKITNGINKKVTDAIDGSIVGEERSTTNSYSNVLLAIMVVAPVLISWYFYR